MASSYALRSAVAQRCEAWLHDARDRGTTGAIVESAAYDPSVTSGSRAGAEHLPGCVDEVRIYDRPLTPDEVAALAM